jgi:hypothetical protein
MRSGRASDWLWLAALLAAIGVVVVRGAEGLLLLGVMAVALCYGIYLQFLWMVVRNWEVSVENERLVVKRSDGRVVGTVVLVEPFHAKCVHYDGDCALYRVTQANTVLRFALPRQDSGSVAKALRLPWPPSSTPYGSWLR